VATPSQTNDASRISHATVDLILNQYTDGGLRIELERCSRCTLPITWETIYLDEEGVCNICRNWEVKQHEIDWNERNRFFLQIVEDARMEAQKNGVPYDCIVPFSGGKDSTYTLWTVVKTFFKLFYVLFLPLSTNISST
jgi:hypothetical protein